MSSRKKQPPLKYERILKGLGYIPVPLVSSSQKYQAWKHDTYKHKVVIVGEDWQACFDAGSSSSNHSGHGIVSLAKTLMNFHQCKFEFIAG